MSTLKKLEILGFKSFSNRRELIFPSGLSVITGPNGSGKSNVAEAICFALGKSSRKELRTEKLGDLVYNGGKKLPQSKFAKVTVVLENRDKRFPLPDEEIKISRMVDRDGKTTFRVNGIRQQKEYVNSMLDQGGVNPDGYNIVQQGEIEKFIGLSTEDRRKLIEELSGISVYEEKKHKTMLELGHVEEKVKEANVILVQKTKYMEGLKKEKEQAEEFVNVRDKLRFKKGAKLKKEYDEIYEEKTKVEKKISESNEELKKVDKKQQNFLIEMGEIDKTIQHISEELEVKGVTEQTELSKTIEELRVKKAGLEAEIKSNLNELKRISERIDSVQKDISENEKKIGGAETEQSEFGGKIAEITKTRDNLKAKYDKLANLDRERLSIREKIAGIENEKNALRNKLDEFEAKIAVQKNIDGFRKELEENSKELSKKLSLDSELGAENRDISEQRNLLLKKLHQLEGKKSVMMNLLDRGTKAILEAKSDGKIKGIIGTISELGKVNEKYAIPLTVAAGNRVKSVVVEDLEVAKQCVEYLRKNQLGYATFIPLDRIERAPGKFKEVKVDGVIDYAINLVKFNAKYENAFWYVLGETLIVKDIDSAKNVGINKIRMVTTEGDLIEKSGVLTGGHRQKEKVGFKDAVDDEMEKLQEEIDATVAKVANIDSKRARLDEEIGELRGRKHFLESQIKDIKVDYSLYEKLKKEFEAREASIKKYNDELKELPKKVDEAELKKLSEQVEKKNTEITELNAKGRGKGFEVQLLQTEIETSRGLIKGFEKEKNAFEKSLETNQKSLEQTNKNLEKKTEDEQRFQGRLRELLEKRNKLNQRKKDFEIKKGELDIEAAKENERLNGHRITMAEVDARLAGKSEALAEYSDLKFEKIKESVEELVKEIATLEQTVQDYGAVNLRALDVYNEVEKEYNALKEKSEKIAAERESVIMMLNEIEDKKKETFLEAFKFVAENFERVFGLLSPNGEGKLILENLENPFEGGVDIIARPGGKKMISLRAMSGGEKTLTTLAFIFAVQEYNPSPFYIMDEVDAALDKENSERLSLLLSQYSKRSQFIVVSHNDSVISQADNLYGVNMNELGESAIITHKLGKK